MKTKTENKVKYSDYPLGNVKRVSDFLPSPAELADKEKNVRVTITLSHDSVQYFKSVAEKGNTQYQKMIRCLLDEYVSAHKVAS